MPITAGLGTAIAAGIGGAATIGGAALQNRAAGKARQEAYKANQEAMAYEQKKQAEAKVEADKRRDAYRTAWQAWAARAGPEGVKRYGVPVGMSYNPTGAPGTGPAGGTPEPTPNPASAPYAMDPNAQAQAPTGAQGPYASQRAGTLGQLMGPGAPVPTANGMSIQPGPGDGTLPPGVQNTMGKGEYGAPLPPGVQNSLGKGDYGMPAGVQNDLGKGQYGAGTIGEMAGWNDWGRYGLGA